MRAFWKWFLIACGTTVAVVGWNFLVIGNLLSWMFGAQFPQVFFWVVFAVSIPVFFAIAYHHFSKLNR